jgi:hypothetical protein
MFYCDGQLNKTYNHPLLKIIVSSTSSPYFFMAIDCSSQERNTLPKGPVNAKSAAGIFSDKEF